LSRVGELKDVSGVLGMLAVIALATLPGVDKELHGVA
jgi:hypothetical protein